MIVGKRLQAPLCEVLVGPSGSGTETRLVLLVALLTVCISGFAILYRNAKPEMESIPDWQVNAFSELRAAELSVFNGLYTAAPEIEMFHMDTGNRWPSIDELAAAYISPFVRDAAWEKNGSYDWSRSIIATQDKHIALYIGHPRKTAKLSSFMLVMLHNHVKKEGNAAGGVHAPFEIWMNTSSVAEAPIMVTDQALINKGWREVVARRGEDETRRTKQEYIQ